MTKTQIEELKKEYNLETYGHMTQYARTKLWNWMLSKLDPKKKCPFCNSTNVIMFTSDDDMCNDCGKSFSGT